MTRPRLLLFALGATGSALIGLLSPAVGTTALERLIRWARPHKRHRRRIRPTVPYHNHRDLISLLRNQGMQANPARKLAEQVYQLQPASFDEAVKLALQMTKEGN